MSVCIPSLPYLFTPFLPHRVYPLLICSSLFRSCSLSGGLFVWPGLKVSKIVLIDTIFLVSVIHRCLLTSSFSLLSFQLYVLGFNIVYFYCTIISLHLSTHQNDYIFTILFNVFLFFSTFTLLKSLVRCSLRYNIFFFSKSKRREEKKQSKILLILVFFPVDEKYKSSLSVPTCYVCHRRLSQCHLMSRENFLLIHKRKKKCTYCPMSRLVVVFLSIATWLLQRFFFSHCTLFPFSNK